MFKHPVCLELYELEPATTETRWLIRSRRAEQQSSHQWILNQVLAKTIATTFQQI